MLPKPSGWEELAQPCFANAILAGIEFLHQSSHPDKTLCWRDPSQLQQLFLILLGAFDAVLAPQLEIRVVSLFVGLFQVSRAQQGQPQVPSPLSWHPSSQLETSKCSSGLSSGFCNALTCSNFL